MPGGPIQQQPRRLGSLAEGVQVQRVRLLAAGYHEGQDLAGSVHGLVEEHVDRHADEDSDGDAGQLRDQLPDMARFVVSTNLSSTLSLVVKDGDLLWLGYLAPAAQVLAGPEPWRTKSTVMVPAPASSQRAVNVRLSDRPVRGSPAASAGSRNHSGM